MQSLDRMASAEVSTPAPASASVPASVPAPASASVLASAPAPAPAPVAVASNATTTDTVKADQAKPPAKKKFSWKGLKKVGPIRLVKGFRAATLHPKISLDSQKDVADNVRQKLFERRNKYEKFVDKVLGKASPVKAEKQPVPGVPSGVVHDGKLNQKKIFSKFILKKKSNQAFLHSFIDRFTLEKVFRKNV